MYTYYYLKEKYKIGTAQAHVTIASDFFWGGEGGGGAVHRLFRRWKIISHYSSEFLGVVPLPLWSLRPQDIRLLRSNHILLLLTYFRKLQTMAIVTSAQAQLPKKNAKEKLHNDANFRWLNVYMSI